MERVEPIGLPAFDVKLPGFTATVSLVDDGLLVHMEGSADLAVQQALAAFVPQVHAAALEHGVELVIADLRAVEFMNSSCIKELVTWLQMLLDLEPERRYRIRLRHGATHHWQSRSLRVLQTFASDLVEIDLT